MSDDGLTLTRIAEVLAGVAAAGPDDPVTFDPDGGAADSGLMGLEDHIWRVIACHVEASLRVLVETTDPEWGMQVHLADVDRCVVIHFPVLSGALGEPERRIDLKALLLEDIALWTAGAASSSAQPENPLDRQERIERYAHLADLFEELATIAREEANR